MNRWPFREGVTYPGILGERKAGNMSRSVNRWQFVSVAEHLARACVRSETY